MAAVQKLVVAENKIKKAVLSGLPLTVTTYTLPHEIEVYIEEVITVFLKFARQENLKDHICYCVHELTANAKKSNTKRVFFTDYNLDITNPDDYQKGMEKFKEITLGNIDYFLQKQKEKGLYIKLILQIRENAIHIEIRNNVAMTRNELIRIHDRLTRSQQYNSLEEALSQVLDDSEGAGLGLVIMALMLKKMGLSKDCFEVTSSEIETIAQLIIPLNNVHVENIAVLSRAIANSVNTLPQFPENIMRIQQLITNEGADMETISQQLSMDPALTADLLKTVNSAQHMLTRRVDNITEAVKMIGIRGIKNMLYSYGTQRILGEDSAEKKLLWEHCYKTAFYGYNLVKNFKHDHNLLDDTYVSGILHDMGKIVFSNIHPKLLEKIKKFCDEKGIPHSTFEDLSAGMNHAEIGAIIAEKWNFPENLAAAIRFHHSPLSAPENYRDLAESVYLANMFCEYENGKVAFDQFEPDVLADFGISDREQLDNLLERFSKNFKETDTQ